MRWLKRMMQIYHLVGIFSSARAFTEYVNMITLEKKNFLFLFSSLPCFSETSLGVLFLYLQVF